ncbi:MAG: hypothetical protein M1504_02945 [Candidatus Marsarchaeota archaeon]|nr:hypothetical protein [Candidatus Marsarchaeota archaeon]
MPDTTEKQIKRSPALVHFEQARLEFMLLQGRKLLNEMYKKHGKPSGFVDSSLSLLDHAAKGWGNRFTSTDYKSLFEEFGVAKITQYPGDTSLVISEITDAGKAVLMACRAELTAGKLVRGKDHKLTDTSVAFLLRAGGELFGLTLSDGETPAEA